MSQPKVDTPAARTGRPMVRRLRVRGWLRLETPLHVGGLGGDPSVDLALALDGRSRLYVPGTSLAGALRAFAERSIASEEVLDGIWGNVPQNVSDAGWASRIIVHDGLVTADTDPGTPLPRSRVEARSGIGIDRVSGAVAHGFLYGRAVLPRGAYLRLELDLESPLKDRDADPATAMLGELLLALDDGDIRLGAARTRGLGSVVLAGKPEIVEQRFDSLDGLLDALGLVTTPETPEAPLLKPRSPGNRKTDAGLLSVKITWCPASPVMVRSGVDGFAINALPLVSGVEDNDQVALVLPGSSIKGALRSHAESIERTARGVDAPHPLEAQAGPARSERFRAQLDQLTAVNALFGSAGKADTDDIAPRWGVGALGADDCYSKQPIPGHVWRALNGAHVEGLTTPPTNQPLRSWEKSRARVEGPVRKKLEQFGMDEANHVAIDRWTGGAADKRLFSTLEPHHVGWQQLKLTVDLRRLRQFAQEDLDKPALALLLFVLRDLCAGRVRFGYGVNRGHGDITVKAIEVSGFPAARTTYNNLDELLAEPAVAECAQSWRDYLDRDQRDQDHENGSRA
ncbi:MULTISPECIES: RAMP superfamily CRISPR-associated protein [unclassified Frankia]|uniref:RAMP superfamily CRISPR-associated protein n=2 Tax=Frankia TaxID=1854 RepID=UPI001EF49299|nr:MULTISPECIES: RAMP superfamily CRISPR-associated protein [unclassified Frankia]